MSKLMYTSEEYRLRDIAHRSVLKAIREGRLTRQPCQECGTAPAEAHHPDYSQPLDVLWLCGACHGITHDYLRQLQRHREYLQWAKDHPRLPKEPAA